MLSIEKQFEELRRNLYRPLLFFIPKSIIPEQALEQIDQNTLDHLLDALIIIKEDGAAYKLKNEPFLYSILQKTVKLDASIFKIFEIKEQLKMEQFEFFIQRYLTEVDFYVFITDWLHNNIELLWRI